MENGKYKYEIHCHTKETSRCGKTTAAELVSLYKSKGYDGVVITDHYSGLTFYKENGFFKRKYKIEKFLKGYSAAREEAGDGFTVLLGMERRAFAHPVDYLVYGMTEDFVEKSGNLLFMRPGAFCKRVKRAGMLVVGAHPYRMFPFMPLLKSIDGIEIFNGKESEENNKKAVEWAKKHKEKFITSGSDFHRPSHQNFGGILTDKKIETNKDLLEILKSGDYTLVTPERTGTQ